MTDVPALKQAVIDHIDRLAPELIDASHQIHAHPELNFEEHFAHDLLTSMLGDHGLTPTRHAYGLATAFEARAGSRGPEIAVLCEYDALPEIGHACGHNIIATAGLGAGLAAALIADEAVGRIRILGTPAEEGGGGKIIMAERGAFEALDAAMMVHPASADLPSMDCVAIQHLDVDFEGQAAHAAAFPHLGRNALDAAVLAYVNVAALRQHIRPNERIHGIFSHGGDKPNIVPHRAAQNWYVRSGTLASLQPLKQRVLTAIEAGAMASGCTCHHVWGDHPYSDMLDSAPILSAYAANTASLGRPLADPAEVGPVLGSTDMGNVSYLVPSIHPMIKVAPSGTAIHTPAFTGYAAGPSGDAGVLDGAKAMALTIIDLWASSALRESAQTQYRRDLERASAL